MNVFRSNLRWVLIAIGVIFVAISAGMVVSTFTGGGWSGLMGLPILAFSVLWTWRAIRSGVTADADGVRSRELMGSSFTRWTDISSIRVEEAGDNAFVPTVAPVISTRSNEQVALTILATYWFLGKRENSKVQREARALEELRRRYADAG